MPAFVAMAGVAAYPLYYGIRASFEHYRYGRQVGGAGLDNYRRVLHDEVFWQAVGTTAKFVALSVSIETVLGLGLALIVNREIRLTKLVRMSLLLPMTIAPVAVGVIWRLIYASDIGFVNPLFSWFGLNGPNVLATQKGAFLGVVAVDVWEWTPLIFLIAFAGLQSLPQEPLEAARVDGAGRLRMFFDHTLPLLLPVLMAGIVLRVIDAIGTFDTIFVLTRGGPGTATQLTSIYAYNTAFQFTEDGLAMAMVVLTGSVVLLLFITVIHLTRRASRWVS